MSSIRSHARGFAFRNFGGTGLVLIYHRVAKLERDPQMLAVTPERFEAHMRVLADNYTVLALPKLIEAGTRRRLPKRCVAVTFDDGYADNLLAAVPILERQGVPATMFVSSGYAKSGCEFWWDDVERIILGPGRLPASIALEVPGARFECDLTGPSERSDADANSDAGWNLLAGDDGEPRHRLYRQLCDFIRPLAPLQRISVLAQLRDAASSTVEPRRTHRPLTVDEVAALDSSPAAAVGSHTVNHPVLSALSIEEQRVEIGDDKRALEHICGRPIDTFSYPYGGLDDYAVDTVALVRDFGFTGACSNHLGVVKPWSDRFRLPRVVVRDCGDAAFSELLEGWFRDPR